MRVTARLLSLVTELLVLRIGTRVSNSPTWAIRWMARRVPGYEMRGGEARVLSSDVARQRLQNRQHDAYRSKSNGKSTAFPLPVAGHCCICGESCASLDFTI